MKIQLINSIFEIPRDEWCSLKMDFAITDGIYDYLCLNEKISSAIKPKFIKIITEEYSTYCLLNEVTKDILDYESNDTWFYDFIRSYFGESVVERFRLSNCSNIALIILNNLNQKISNEIVDKLSEFTERHSDFKNSFVIFNSWHNCDNLKYITTKQKPYMYFDLNKIYDSDEFINSQKSKIKNNLKRDKMLLLQNNVVLKEISFKENIQQILELNKKSKYPALEESIHLIGNLEEMGSIHTIGFFKNENLVQYLTVIIEDKFSYILCVNMSEDIREWSGILNAYRIFVEVSLKYGVKIAYVGYECIDEKLKRGAQMLEKYFIYK